MSMARGLRDVVAAEAVDSEQLRTMSPPIVDALWSSGLMTAFNPREAGGVEPGFAEMIETWIEMAWQDGSFGWNDRHREFSVRLRRGLLPAR